MKATQSQLAVTQEEPSYLTGKERTGAEVLGKDDVKVPRIKLLQALNPEIRSFQGKAIPGEFWHTGANVSLGSEFIFVPIIIGKRVVVWRPRNDQNGGILAMSRDAIKWQTGANQTFEVRLKDIKKPVKWSTGKDVASSGLLEFGTSNPENENSAPAAVLQYEYLCYLIANPELSPVVMGVMKTGIPNAKALNTWLLSTRKPINACAIKVFADETTKNSNVWTIPKFDRAGWASSEIFKLTEKFKEQYQDYDIDLEQEEEGKEPIDEIRY